MSAGDGASASAATGGGPREPGPYAPGAAAAGSLGATPALPAAPSLGGRSGHLAFDRLQQGQDGTASGLQSSCEAFPVALGELRVALHRRRWWQGAIHA
eukprot:1689340-Pyramimonas_sp.AAC.1